MKIISNRRRDPEFLVFKFLWLLIIMPKTIQFIILAMILLYSSYKNNKYSLSITMQPFMVGVAIQLIAIACQVITKNVESDRLMASFNTALIWVLSAYYFSIFAQKKYDPNSIYRLKKYILINFAIIILLYIFSFVYKGSYINILGSQLPLRQNDYISGSLGSRFCALMETPLASSHFFLFSIPLIMYPNIYDKRHRLVELVIVIGGFISCVAAHSRIGMVVSWIVLMLYLFSVLQAYGMKKRTKAVFVAIISVAFVMFLSLSMREIFSAAYSFFLSREGSNNARFQVYRLSIEKVWKESPIIGIGVKYMINNYIPYGSHSTYIGIFYKTGILGCAFFLWGFIKVISRVRKNTKTFINGTEIFIAFISYFGFLVFADIDGIDWVMVCLFSMWGLLCNAIANNTGCKTLVALE